MYDIPNQKLRLMISGRDIFLANENKHYTHFVICPDDLIIKREHVNQIYLDLLYLQTLGIDQSVCIGGFCNLNTTDKKDLSNICIERVNIEPYPNRRYNFATLKELRDLRVKHKMRYIPVGFSGFPLMAVPRNILKDIEFRNDSEDGWQDYGCCVDVMFCHDVYESGFKVLCDLDLEMHHMKIDDFNMQNFYVNIKEPKRYFEYKIN